MSQFIVDELVTLNLGTRSLLWTFRGLIGSWVQEAAYESLPGIQCLGLNATGKNS